METPNSGRPDEQLKLERAQMYRVNYQNIADADINTSVNPFVHLISAINTWPDEKNIFHPLLRSRLDDKIMNLLPFRNLNGETGGLLMDPEFQKVVEGYTALRKLRPEGLWNELNDITHNDNFDASQYDPALRFILENSIFFSMPANGSLKVLVGSDIKLPIFVGNSLRTWPAYQVPQISSSLDLLFNRFAQSKYSESSIENELAVTLYNARLNLLDKVPHQASVEIWSPFFRSAKVLRHGDKIDDGIYFLGKGVPTGMNQIEFLHNETTSRLHAAVSISDGNLRVVDLGSSRGTYSNGNRLESFIRYKLTEANGNPDEFMITLGNGVAPRKIKFIRREDEYCLNIEDQRMVEILGN